MSTLTDNHRYTPVLEALILELKRFERSCGFYTKHTELVKFSDAADFYRLWVLLHDALMRQGFAGLPVLRVLDGWTKSWDQMPRSELGKDKNAKEANLAAIATLRAELLAA